MTAASDPYADLRKLLMTPATEEVAGVQLSIAPFVFEQLPHMLDLVTQAKEFIRIGLTSLEVDVQRLIAQQYPLAVELIATLSGQPAEWVRGLRIDQALFLLTVYVRVNADFFIRHVAPMVMLALSSLERSESPSPASSQSSSGATTDAAGPTPSAS